MLTAILFAATAATFPTINEVPTGVGPLTPNPTATQFTLVVAGDTGPAKSGDLLTTPLTDIVAALVKPPPAFVVWNGDVVYGKTHTGIEAEYSQFLAAFASL